MLHTLIAWLVETVGALGYPGIIILMALESSFFPFPSEVVMIPAGYLVQQGEMNFFAVLAAGVTGSLVGAWVNYALAVSLGRAALLKWGKKIFLPREKFERAEIFLRVHGEVGTFIGRLIPVIRQYISFPAGLVRMSFWRFSFFTALGAGIWMTILTLIGYYAGENQALIQEWSRTALFLVLVGSAILVIAYWKLRKRS